METYVPGANGSTMGCMYTNGQHVDLCDAACSMLPVLGEPAAGGHFVHGIYGRTQQLHSRGICCL